ncbi:MAG: FAD-dependent oxidoreductase, partial [Devosia sp.]
MSTNPNRLDADAKHEFGGVELDRTKPLSFRVDGHRVHGYQGDTVLSALLASGIIGAGAEDGSELGLDERFAPPLVAARAGDRTTTPLPPERTPALDGFDLVSMGNGGARTLGDRVLRRAVHSLGHRFQGSPLLQPWVRLAPAESAEADLVIVGGGVAGLSAAELAGAPGRKVIVIERRPWLGGDARYFGPVGNDETPEAIETRLIARLSGMDNIRIWTATEAFDVAGGAVSVHRVEIVDGKPVARVIRIAAHNVILATGAIQRLPVFAGNRLPGVVGSAAAYHR